MTTPSGWSPNWHYTHQIANALMDIARASASVEQYAWSPWLEEDIRWKARLRSTHFSTRIEGNRLTLAEAEEVIRHGKVDLAGRKRDVREVDNYWQALLRVEEWARERTPVTERLIQKLHAIIEKGPKRAATPFREQQNVIRDSGTGALVYLPPEAHDVPALMAGLVAWIAKAEKEELPVPILAGLAHYQFVTIHPFLDGNGRTARLLATLLLHRGGMGLRGFFSLEEYHARDIDAYYRELRTHEHHNYYMGRETADLTAWVEYFTAAVADVFSVARDEAIAAAKRGVPAEPPEVQRLDTRARRVLALFRTADSISVPDLASIIPGTDRNVRIHLARWVEEGFLTITDPSNRRRRYGLSEVYRQYVVTLSQSSRPAAPTESGGVARLAEGNESG